MTKIINLNKARKLKQRLNKEETAAENRIKYGMKKAEKSKLKVESLTSNKKIDSHKLTGKDEDK